MSPQKMLYVKEEDIGLIEKAQFCSKENFSNTVVKALKWYVDSQQDVQFEFQKITVGCDCTADFPFDEVPDFPDELDYMGDSEYANLVFDELLPRTFPKTKITFFGVEIFSSTGMSGIDLVIRDIPGLELHEKIIFNAYAGNFDNADHIRSFNSYNDSGYIEGITTTFTAFKTRGGKYLIKVEIYDLDSLRNNIDLEFGCYIPDPTDYFILNKLDEKIQVITTETLKIEIELPKTFMRQLIEAEKSAQNEIHLDI